jgi:2-polyprenyl-3-methyl-5-hydroxy-6-metoxy-1,4-benzoquinol methylase
LAKDILQEQIAYYRARAQEYDESLNLTENAPPETKDDPQANEFTALMETVSALPPVQSVLELAGGTGIWTQLLAQIGQSITVVDASQEMLTINYEKVQSARVNYIQADLFTWKPEQQYDLVFFAFWLSHVPPERLDDFLDVVKSATNPGGKIVIVDQSEATEEEIAVTDGIEQARTLADGRQFTIVKVYYDPAVLQEKLAARGFQNVSYNKGEYFFYLTAQ